MYKEAEASFLSMPIDKMVVRVAEVVQVYSAIYLIQHQMPAMDIQEELQVGEMGLVFPLQITITLSLVSEQERVWEVQFQELL